ncbi:protein-disulfide reductase DsbD domain-containing protein [Agaricicola taiwanensis]|nr:protein-disulfide reductase DsbD domain-containing protein [Agaricicola taiwanensis]
MLLIAAFLAITGVARAETTSAWAGDGSSAIRLISGRAPEADGSSIVGIEIRLQPGWKTYWREPGESGIPPRFDWAGSENLKKADVLFPAPKRFKEGDSWTVGYDRSVVLPVRLIPEDPARPVRLALSMDYAVCEKLCVPAHGQVHLQRGPQDAVDRYTAANIEKSLKRLPRKATLDSSDVPSVSVNRADNGALIIAVRGDGEADLFAHGDGRWSPPLPIFKKEDAEGRRLFYVKTNKAPAGASLSLVAVSGETASEIVLDARTSSP